MTDYHRVAVMDPDMAMFNPSDELYEMNESLLYTVGQDGFMGGWWLVKPNRTMYDDMVAIIRKGDFRRGSGWEVG
jgi:hypothetical protein